MSRRLLILCLVSSFLISHIQTAPFQDGRNDKTQIEWVGPIENCPEGQDQSNCITQMIQELKPIVQQGLESFGPVHVGSFNHEINEGSVNLNLLSKDVTVYGVPNYGMMKIKFDTNTKQIYFIYEVPVLKIQLNYKIGGKVLFFPIKGTGPTYMELYGLKTQGNMKFIKKENENGDKIIQIDEIKFNKTSIQDIKARFRGLFDGNPILNAASHYFLNNYGSEIFNLIKPDVEKYTTDVMIRFINSFLKTLPEFANYVPDN